MDAGLEHATAVRRAAADPGGRSEARNRFQSSRGKGESPSGHYFGTQPITPSAPRPSATKPRAIISLRIAACVV